jgi:hypothetical protein
MLTYQALSVNGFRSNELFQNELEMEAYKQYALQFFERHEMAFGFTMCVPTSILPHVSLTVQRAYMRIFPMLGMAPCFLSAFNLVFVRQEVIRLNSEERRATAAGASALD